MIKKLVFPNNLFSRLAVLLLLSISANSTVVKQLYQKHCAACHGQNRLGINAPPLLKETLNKYSLQQIKNIIANGRQATQMPAFSAQLSSAQISKLSDYINHPSLQTTTWSNTQIIATHQLSTETLLLASPSHKSDMLNLFIVVEKADSHISIVDGDNLKTIARLKTNYGIHGGAKFAHQGRFAYLLSRDGWVSLYDLYHLKKIASIRVGINSRNIALASNDKWLIAANYLPHNLVILDAKTLMLVATIDAKDINGKTSRVSAVYNNPINNSFIVSFKDSSEIWALFYTTASTKKQPLIRMRRLLTPSPLENFFFDDEYKFLIAKNKNNKVVIINLDTAKIIKTLNIGGIAHLGAGISWNYNDTIVAAFPNLAKNELVIIDTNNWEIIKKIKTLGRGFFLRSHRNSPYVWADVFFGAHKDVVHIIDKQSLAIVKTLTPLKNKVSAHVEFDRYGRYALLSIWEDEGFIIAYNAKTLQEITRIPMAKPSGKYNVYNKINYTSGTSH